MGFVENVNTLASNLTVGNIANIGVVVANQGGISTVAANIGDVGIVAGDILSVKTTATNIANVNAVGANIADVSALVPVVADMDLLSPQAANIGIVGANIASVVTTASNIGSVGVVAADIALTGYSDTDDLGLITVPVTVTPSTGVSVVKTVADNITNVNITGTNIANVNAVGSNIANVNTVAGSIAGVNSVATTVVPNIAELLQVNDNAALVVSILDQFDDRYLGSKSVKPIVDNDGNALLVGALYFDTVTNMMRVWDGSAWSDALTLTAGSISTVTNKTMDSLTNKIGADHVHYGCRNASGSTIPAGTVVTASGTQPGTDYIQIVPLTNNQTQVALGITHTQVLNNGTGLVINTGLSTDVVNTSAWAVGTILYVGATGGFTDVKPSSGVYQACAVVLRSHANQGTMLVEFTEPKSTTAKIIGDILTSGIALDMGSIV